jgi:glutamate-ammonia-ligase adenylyltransferase
LFRIGARDVLGSATLDDTLAAITTLAEVAIDAAVTHLRAWLARETGDAVDADGRPIGFVVLGLGKLGGGELNYSSDVDLVYLHEGAPPAAGAPDPKDFFSRLASEVTRAIGEQTADGVVFRVDLRLRPEGAAGVLVNSVDGALTYYEGWGDTWERGALAKARPVGGDVVLGEHFIEEVRPFVYRRHLDYQTLEDLRRMKARVDAEQAEQAPGIRDVKLGAGCIREVEFVVQALQLIHGGHEAAVRVPGTRAALRELERHAMVSGEEAAMLREAYVFLRDVEHAIQVVEQRRTQRLPTDAVALRALARRLGYGTGRRGRPAGGDELAAFESDWARHTTDVRDAFVRFLELKPSAAERAAADDPGVAAILASLERGDRDAAAHLLSTMGFPTHRRRRTRCNGCTAGAWRPASPQRRRAVESMAPALLRAAVSSADPDGALDRLVDFLARTGAHTSYLALLGGSRATMELLLTVFATSPYLASHLVGHPELIDVLVRSDEAAAVRDRDALSADLATLLAAGGDDEEHVLAALRMFRNAEILRIGMQDLAGVLDAEQVHQRSLSLPRSACITRSWRRARSSRSAALPRGSPWHRWRWTISSVARALGKMGGREMTYASDLDLLFVYDTERGGFDGDAHGFATRWAQKAMSLLQTRTRDGIAYAIDARLRPSGRSGPLVISLERFLEYHREEAELLERQSAHSRARRLRRSVGCGARVRARGEFRVRPGLDAAGIRAIDELRRRMEAELAQEGPRKRNIKTGRGGIVDIEFVVQMLQLRHGHGVPAVRAHATLDGLRALRDAGLIARDDTERLISHYSFLRRLEARMR